MKKEELEALGLNEEQIAGVFRLNGKDINDTKSKLDGKHVDELRSKLREAEKERDSYKEQFEKADTALKEFDGADAEKLKAEYEKAIADLKEEYRKKDEAREYADLVDAAVAELKFTSNSAKKAFAAELKADPLKVKGGKLIGFQDFVDSYKEADASAFVDEEQENANQNAARFTKRKENGSSGMTKEDILKITDRTERQQAIAEHPDLFGIN